VWVISSFLGAMVIPLLNGSNQAIWQSKVAPDVQGRVFSARRLIAWVTNPITPVIAGVLADQWLEPALRTPSTFAQMFGPIFGTGPGAGMAVLMAVSGVLVSVVGAAGYLFKAVRDAEDILPDHNAA
jgi:hypothetical protein